MLGTLIQKELRSIILSPKFAVTFAVCSILLLLSVYIGIQEYQQATAQYDTATKLAEQRMQEQTSWHAVSDKVYRVPDPVQVFSSGLSYDIGRWSEITSRSTVKLKNSVYSDDPIFAVFRFIDFTFVVQIVFSLLAILFTYDAINGEREQGTLRLVFSNAVPRARYIVAKCAGAWLGLVVPICIPVLLALLLVNSAGVTFSSTDWIRVGLLAGISLLYMTLFVMLGVFISSLTKRSSVSFLISLVVWIAFVLIIPRAGVMAAGQMVNVPQLAEIEGMRDGYSNNQWAVFNREAEERFRVDHGMGESGGCPAEVDDEAMWEQMQREDSARKVVQQDIEAYEGRLMEDWNRRKEVQQRLGFTLSRFSPAAAYQLAAMALARTDVTLKSEYEESLQAYRTDFNEYVEKKSAESGQVAGLMISISSEDGMKIGGSRDNAGLDISDRPVFTPPEVRAEELVEPVIADVGILVFGTILLFAAAFVSFLRYDLR